MLSVDGRYYYLYDAVGNVIGVLENGINLYRWEMDAFGNWLDYYYSFLPMNHPGPKEHLTGKLYDTTTGLYYFHARWYDPLVGRFVSRDPVQKADNRALGMPSCGLGSHSEIAPHPYALLDPRFLNQYIISQNNPLYFVDPEGEWAFIVEFVLAIGLHFELGCMPGSCCWLKLHAALGIGVGWSIDPSATHPCPPVSCECLGLSYKCEASLAYLIGQIGLETGQVTPILCSSTTIPVPPAMSYRGPTSSTLAKGGLRVAANCSVGFTVTW